MSSVPAIVCAARIGVRVVDQQRLAVLGDPAGEPFADAAAQQVHVDVLVGADPALEGDRHHLVGQLDEVDAGVVVVDDPAGLLDDRPARPPRRTRPGSGARRRPAGPRAGRRAPRSARRARRCVSAMLGVRGQGGQERDVAVGPLARLAGDGGQRPDDPVVVDERRDEVAGERDDALVVARRRGGRSSRASDQAATCPVRRTSPTQPSSTPNTGSARATLSDRPAQAATTRPLLLDDADRHVIDPQGAQRLVDDRPEQLRAIVRGGQPFGDVQDRVEPLGELGLGAVARVCRQRHRRRARTAEEAAVQRGSGQREIRIRSGLGRGVVRVMARAHGRCIVPLRDPSCRRTIGTCVGVRKYYRRRQSHGQRGPRSPRLGRWRSTMPPGERPKHARREVGWGRR